MVDHKHYTWRVTWSEEDGEHVALCAEFPGLSFLADKPVDALRGLVRLVGEVMEDMAENGEPIPEPLAKKSYSGKFQVRVPPEQHRNLAIQAAEQGVSLNRFVSARLA